MLVSDVGVRAGVCRCAGVCVFVTIHIIFNISITAIAVFESLLLFYWFVVIMATSIHTTSWFYDCYLFHSQYCLHKWRQHGH